MGVRIPVVVDGEFAANKAFIEAFVLCSGDYLCADALSGVTSGESIVNMVEHRDIGMAAAEVDLDRLRRSPWYEFAQLARSVGLASLSADDPEVATRVLLSTLLALRTILSGNGGAAASHMASIVDDLMNNKLIVSGFTNVDINGLSGRLTVAIGSVEQMWTRAIVVDVTLSNADLKLVPKEELRVDTLRLVREARGFMVEVPLGVSTYVSIMVYDDGERYVVGYKVAYSSESGVDGETLRRAASTAARLAAALVRGDEVEAREAYEELGRISGVHVYILEEEW